MSLAERIDIHAHFIPPFYRTACEQTGNSKPDGMPAIPEWSEEAHLDLMRENSITTSIISISSPGIYLIPGDNASARKLARQCNEFAADLSRKRPQEFGFWACLPLPDVQGSLEEITYALDTLNAAGVALETNHHGTYLGDPSFNAVFDELNRRKAIVFIHPTSPCLKGVGSHNHTTVTFLPHFPNPMMEFMFDTARAVFNLFISGTLARCPHIQFVIPHAGGALPPILQRFSTFTRIIRSELDLSAQAVKETFRRQFYFDLAGFPFPDQIHGILRVVGPERLLYGSDYPFTPPPMVAELAEMMRSGLEEIFTDEHVRGSVYAGNARRLLAGVKRNT